MSSLKTTVKCRWENHLHHFHEHRIMFYNYYIKPIIQYGLIIYGSTSKSTLEPILMLQKNILWIIFNKSKSHRTKTLFRNRKIMTVFELYVSELLKYGLCNFQKLKKKYSRDFEGRTLRKNKCFYFKLKLQNRYLRESPETRCLRLLNKLCELKILTEIKTRFNDYEVKKIVKNISTNFFMGNDQAWDLFS